MHARCPARRRPTGRSTGPSQATVGRKRPPDILLGRLTPCPLGHRNGIPQMASLLTAMHSANSPRSKYIRACWIFVITSIILMLAAWPISPTLAVAVIAVMLTIGVALGSRIRCPGCDAPIRVKNHAFWVSVPRTCEKCGTSWESPLKPRPNTDVPADRDPRERGSRPLNTDR